MELPINDKYQISGDSQNWSIDKKVSVKNKKTKEYEDKWVGFKFYGSLTQAVNGLAEYTLMTSDAKTLADALSVNKKTLQALTEALTPEYEVKVKGSV